MFKSESEYVEGVYKFPYDGPDDGAGVAVESGGGGATERTRETNASYAAKTREEWARIA